MTPAEFAHQVSGFNWRFDMQRERDAWLAQIIIAAQGNEDPPSIDELLGR